MQQFKKQLISFDTITFQNEVLKYKLDQTSLQAVQAKYKELTGVELLDCTNIIEQAYNHFERSKDNVMNLSGAKYCEVKEIDLTALKSLVSKFENLPEPNQDDFSIFTVDEAANEKLKAFRELQKAYSKFAALAGFNDAQLLVSLKQAALFSHHLQAVVPNPNFINGIEQRY
jgi:hypothetical protein